MTQQRATPKSVDFHTLAERTFLNLPYEPTGQQVEVIGALARFCSGANPDDSVFILNGYAGTGKTSLMGALVRTLASLKIQVVLMAPTGRAAKVFGNFAKHFATTIHRRIYRSPVPGVTGSATSLAENNAAGAVFIVDEASMIGGEGSVPDRPGLLEDLVYYVYSGISCRMILVGDTAQLPPVGCNESPAMDNNTLRNLGLHIIRATMTATVRQTRDSGILFNATWLRRAMKREPIPEPVLHLKGLPGVETVEGTDLEDSLSTAYSDIGIDNTLIVTRSNRMATAYNLAVRQRILELDEELCCNERLLVVKNNYFWSGKIKGLDFIANGDTGIIQRIIGTEERYGLRFADIELTLTDRPEPLTFEVKVILDVLTSDTPALPAEKMQTMARMICTEAGLAGPDIPPATQFRLLRSDPYFNALQIKYAYAMTCHKSQGGQWNKVYIDMGYIPPEAFGLEFYRWLYTATTRAVSTVCYINPHIQIK